jgi:hypothetical protein
MRGFAKFANSLDFFTLICNVYMYAETWKVYVFQSFCCKASLHLYLMLKICKKLCISVLQEKIFSERIEKNLWH